MEQPNTETADKSYSFVAGFRVILCGTVFRFFDWQNTQKNLFFEI